MLLPWRDLLECRFLADSWVGAEPGPGGQVRGVGEEIPDIAPILGMTAGGASGPMRGW